MIYEYNKNSKESFIVYKFMLNPELVLSNKYYNDSYPYLFFNKEFLNFLSNNIKIKNFYDSINSEILLNIKRLLKEEINFFENYNYISQRYSNKNIDVNKQNNKEELFYAKYICFKEAYDLEIDIKKIYDLDIEKVQSIINTIEKIISPTYSEKLCNVIRKNIIDCLNEDIKSDKISTTFEDGYVLYNINHFKALVCSNEILKNMEILYNQGKLSSKSIDFCIQLLNYSIFAKTKTLVYQKTFILEKETIDSYDSITARNLKNLLVCEKYKKERLVKYIH